MKSKFIALDKAGVEAEWFWQFWRVYFYGLSEYPPYAFTATTKWQILKNKILYITVSLDTFIENIISLDSSCQMKLFQLTLWRQKIT